MGLMKARNPLASGTVIRAHGGDRSRALRPAPRSEGALEWAKDVDADVPGTLGAVSALIREADPGTSPAF